MHAIPCTRQASKARTDGAGTGDPETSRLLHEPGPGDRPVNLAFFFPASRAREPEAPDVATMYSKYMRDCCCPAYREAGDRPA